MGLIEFHLILRRKIFISNFNKADVDVSRNDNFPLKCVHSHLKFLFIHLMAILHRVVEIGYKKPDFVDLSDRMRI